MQVFVCRRTSRARSLVIGGCGYGAEKSKRTQFQDEAEHAAQMFDRIGMAEGAQRYALGGPACSYRTRTARMA